MPKITKRKYCLTLSCVKGTLKIKEWFNGVWSKECLRNRKIRFYNDIKDAIRLEPYFTNFSHKSATLVAIIRSSYHRLNIESGRNDTKSLSLHNRCWPTCTDQDALEYTTAFPGQHDHILEDERHVQEVCPFYEDIRLQLQDGIRQHLQLHEGNYVRYSNTKTSRLLQIISKRFEIDVFQNTHQNFSMTQNF